MIKRFTSIVVTTFLLLTILPIPVYGEENRPVDRGDGVLENTGDWLIEEGEDFQYDDKTIIVNGNLTVNGSLTLNRCKLIMNASYSAIRVNGNLDLDTTNITGNDTFYYFIVAGGIDFQRSNLFDIAGSTTYPYIGGLQLFTDDVTIDGGSIQSAEFTGLYLKANVTITNLSIFNNEYNLVMNRSKSQFFNCTIRYPWSVNIFMVNGSSPMFIEGIQAGEKKFDDEVSSLSIGYSMHVHVAYKNDTSIPDAKVTVTSVNGNISEASLTDHSGWVRNMIFPEETIFKSRPDKVYHPYRVTAEKFGLVVIESVTFDSETTVRIVLSGDHFGEEITRGDFNGDGLPDLAVGVPKNRTGITTPGAVFIYLNDGALELTKITESMADIVIRGMEGTGFGSVLSAGDINGDGYDDLLVSSPYSSDNGDQSGRVHFFYGSDQPSWEELTDSDFTLDGDQGAHLGKRLFTCNLNNDEFSDFIVGDAYSSHVYYGNPDPKDEFTRGGLHYLAPAAKGDEDTTGENITRIHANDNDRYPVKNPNTPNNVMHLTNFPVDQLKGDITLVTLWIQFTTDKDYGINDHERSYIYYHVGNGWQESLRPIRNGNNWRAETTWTYNLLADGVTTKEQLQQLQLYLDNVDGTGLYCGTENNIYFDYIVLQVNTAPMPANHTLEAGNLSSGDINGDGYPDLIISDRTQQVIYFGGPSGLVVPKPLHIDYFQGNVSGSHADENGLSLARIGQIVNGDFENGWDNWTFIANTQGHKNANLRMVIEEEGDWEISEYSGGPTGGYGGDGDHLNGFGGKSTGKLRSDPFHIGEDVDAISLWYRWQVISFDRNEGINIKIYRSSDDTELGTIDEWMPSVDSSRYEKEESVMYSVTALRGEMVYLAMETIGGDGGYDDGLFQIDDLDLFPYIYHQNGTFTSNWITFEGNISSYTPEWNEELNNGTLIVTFRTDPGTDWSTDSNMTSGQLVTLDVPSSQIQLRLEMTNNGSATPIPSDLKLTYQLEGQIMPLPLQSNYGLVGAADMDGDSLDDLLFLDNQGKRNQGIDIFYGHRNFSQEYDESSIEGFFNGDVSGFSVLDLESDGLNELCIIGDTIRIIDSNAEILWERSIRTSRIHEDVASDPSFKLNTGSIYFLPSKDQEVRVLDISIPTFIDPGEELSMDITVGNIGSNDQKDLMLFLNITADGYSYSDSTLLDILSLQSGTHGFVWDVPRDEGVNYTIIAEIPLTGDRVPDNNILNLTVVSKRHAIQLTTSDPIRSAHCGDELTYSLTIRNIGTFDTENVTLESSLPIHWTGEYYSDDRPVHYIVVDEVEELVFTTRSPMNETHSDFLINLSATANTTISYLEVTASILRPDLRVDEIQLLRADGTQTNDTIHGVADEQETIKIKVTNHGLTYVTGFNLTLLVEGVPYEMFDHSSLASGESTWFSSVIEPGEGSLNLSAEVDPGDDVPEENETNNQHNVTFAIKGTDPIGPYEISGYIQNIHGEGVGFADVRLEWNGVQENTYTDGNGSFVVAMNSTAYFDGDILYLNASDGENITNVRFFIYSEDGGKYLVLTLNQYMVEVTGPDRISTADLNDTILIILDITNKGNTNATFIVLASEVPEDWSVHILDLPSGKITLEIEEFISVTIEITTSSNPIYSKGYQKYFISILVYSEVYSPGNDSFTHGIEILPTQSLHIHTVGDNATSARPGDELRFSFIVENLGNEGNTFIPELLGNAVQSYEFNVSYLSIDIGRNAGFSLTLITPYQAFGSGIELQVGGTESYILNTVIQLTIRDMYGVSCSQPAGLTAAPGDILSVPLSIENSGNLQDNITISGQSENPAVGIHGGWVLLDMQEEITFPLRISLPPDAISGERIPVTLNLTTSNGTYITLEVNITIIEVRGISLTLMVTHMIPATDFTLYSFDIEAHNIGNGQNTFYFKAEGSHPNLMAIPNPITLEPGLSEMIHADIIVPFNLTSVIDNYLIPLDGRDDYEDLNLRILSYTPKIDTNIEVSQVGSTYYYDIFVTNNGPRFERLDIAVKMPKVDNYQPGDTHWEGGTNKQFLEMLPGNTDHFRVWITTPHHREYWGSDLTVTLKSESGKSEKITLHKPPIAIIGSTIPDLVTFEEIITFTGSQSLWNIKECFWSFGDGSYETNSTVSHSFGRSGSHLVTLTVRDENNLTASSSIIIDVVNTEPIAVIRVHPLNRTVKVDQYITLDASFSQDRDGEIVEYLWEFDEPGEIFDGMAPVIEHSYSRTGNYPIILFVKDNSGNTSNTTTTIIVIPRSEDIGSSKDGVPGEKTTIAPISYLPAALIVTVLLAGLIIICKKKMFINDLFQKIGDQSKKK